MRYISTRGGGRPLSAGQALLQGLADDGGLYVPEHIPPIGMPLDDLLALTYQDMAFEILKLYLTDYTEQELRNCIVNAYRYPRNFDDPLVAPLKTTDGIPLLELFHGRTLAFKDMALSLLPYLLTTASAKYSTSKKTVILTATSGDTGKAALEGFADVEGVSIVVFYPESGVSAMQKRQMVTQEGGNTFVIGVRGNFDDTQTGVKRIFGDTALTSRMAAEGIAFSSANSINIGRLLPQVVYYFYAYAQLVQNGSVAAGEAVNFTVPTGNFGNILAGYYAKRMGLPIKKLICASNDNRVLCDFFNTGVYDVNRPFFVTISPSMDILVSSNLERLLFHAAEDTGHIKTLMSQLNTEGLYRFDIRLPDFCGVYATEAQTRETIHDRASRGYCPDPHTAVALYARAHYIAETGDDTPNIVVSTASPFKFLEDVCAAIEDPSRPACAGEDASSLMQKLASHMNVPAPSALQTLMTKETRHTVVCDVDEMKQTLTDIVIFPSNR